MLHPPRDISSKASGCQHDPFPRFDVDALPVGAFGAFLGFVVLHDLGSDDASFTVFDELGKQKVTFGRQALRVRLVSESPDDRGARALRFERAADGMPAVGQHLGFALPSCTT